MSEILEQAQKVETFRRLLNASNSSPGETEFDLLLRAFAVERERLMEQSIGKALDGLILAHAAGQAAVALIGGAEKLDPDGVRCLARDLVLALDNFKTYFETESGTTLDSLNLDARNTLH